MFQPRTLFDKLWEAHVVAGFGGATALLHVDRLLLHDLSGTRALKTADDKGYAVRNPELVVACPDHTVSTEPGSVAGGERFEACVAPLERLSRANGIRYFGADDPGFGILHVIGPETGITLPGTTVVCGDSHTCTHGALATLAWGAGASEIVHVLATQTIRQNRPKRMRVDFGGALQDGVGPKDLILHLIGREGAAAGNGYAVEYAGSAIGAMSMEGRMTVCNLSIEMGAKIGLIAADETTLDYVEGRQFAPRDDDWDAAVEHWQGLTSDEGARFEREIHVDASGIAPQVTWGTSPEHVVGIDEAVPDPGSADDADRRHALQAALAYSGVEPGRPMEGLAVDRVFIGSCTNSRLSDLREAAAVVRDRKVAAGVEAWVVPGSRAVKRAAEAEGLDRVFTDAGFHWREPGCSLCVGANGEQVAPGQRCISTSNRNFVGRQGKDSRTHLAGPAMAAAAAVKGHITDVRRM